MTDEARYVRQVILPEVGPSGQRRLQASEVVVEGDHLSSRVCALYLAGAGVGRLQVADALVGPCLRLNPSVDVRGGAARRGLTVRTGGDVHRPADHGGSVDRGARAALWALRRILG